MNANDVLKERAEMMEVALINIREFMKKAQEVGRPEVLHSEILKMAERAIEQSLWLKERELRWKEG